MRKFCMILVLLFVLALFKTPAFSEEGLNAQLFRPSIFGGNFVAFDDANTLCPMGWHGGLLFDYAKNPLVNFDGDEPDFSFITELYTAHLMLAFGPFSFLSIGAEVPVNFARNRSVEDIENLADIPDLESNAGLGDILARIKLRLLRQEKHWLGMALAPYITFPTGDDKGFLGEGRATGGVSLTLERDFEILNLGLNGGYKYRGESEIGTVDVGDAINLGGGVSRAFDNGLSFSIEYVGSWLNASETEQFRGNPMEIIATLRYQFGARGPRLIGGGGTGLTHGAGSPSPRLLAGVDYTYCKPKPTLGNLIINTVDQNNDLLAANLRIIGPTQKQIDVSSAGEWTSKAKPGRYKVTALKEDYKPQTAEAVVEVGKTTQISLVLNEIPTLLTVIVTDKNTGQNLGSNVSFDFGTDKEMEVSNPTGEFTREWNPGSYQIKVSAKGYEIKLAKITIKKAKRNVVKLELRRVIEKTGKIHFDYDSDVIREESYPVLDDVVDKIKLLGEYKKIVIEGHCSGEGTEEYNMDLSKRRSISVKDYLVKRGVDASKLEIMPFGESRPIASNETEEGRAQNRRVEFIIEE